MFRQSLSTLQAWLTTHRDLRTFRCIRSFGACNTPGCVLQARRCLSALAHEVRSVNSLHQDHECLAYRRFETREQKCASCSGCRRTKSSSAWACLAISSRLCVSYSHDGYSMSLYDADCGLVAPNITPASVCKLQSTTLLLCCRLRWAAPMCVLDRQSLAQETMTNEPLTVAILIVCTHELHGNSASAPAVMLLCSAACM